MTGRIYDLKGEYTWNCIGILMQIRNSELKSHPNVPLKTKPLSKRCPGSGFRSLVAHWVKGYNPCFCVEWFSAVLMSPTSPAFQVDELLTST